MNNYYVKPKTTQKAQRLARTNAWTAIHDLHCDCNQPLQHIITDILQQEPSLKNDEKFKQNIQQCLGITGAGDTQKEEEDILGDVDLERFFDADFTEEDTG